MADAQLDTTFVWRTNIAKADLSTAAIRSVRTDQMERLGNKIGPIAPSDVNELIAAATLFMPEGDKAGIAERFARLKPNFQTLDEDAGDRKQWESQAESDRARDPDGAQHRHRLSTILSKLACDPNGAPYVARGLIGSYGGMAVWRSSATNWRGYVSG
jgi:hypothetical protein